MPADIADSQALDGCWAVAALHLHNATCSWAQTLNATCSWAQTLNAT